MTSDMVYGSGALAAFSTHRHLRMECILVVGSREGVPLQYKFIVDGEWKYAPDMPAMHDERNIINNVVEVQEYVPDHLDSLVGFEPPPSPPERSELITQPGPGSTFNFLHATHTSQAYWHLA